MNYGGTEIKMKKQTYEMLIGFALHFIPITILGWLMVDAVFFTPLIRWNWGFYNIEMIVTMCFGVLYILWMIWWNTIKILKEKKQGGLDDENNRKH